MNISNSIIKIIFLIIFSFNTSAFAQIKSDNILPNITNSDVKLFPTYKISYFNVEDSRNDIDKRMVTEICGNWTSFFEFDYPENDTIKDYLADKNSNFNFAALRFDYFNPLNVTWKEVIKLKELSKNKYTSGELPNGNWIFTYQDGTIMATGKFIKGKPEGEWLYYDIYGKIEAIENYTSGLPDGTWKTGKYTKSFKNGFAHGIWSLNMGEEVIIFNFNEGRIDGEQKVNLYGKEFLKFNFKNDKLNGELTLVSLLNPNEIRVKGNFLNGVPNGDWNYHGISEYHREENSEIVNSYYNERHPISSNNIIYKKVVYSSNKISEFENFNNTELKLVAETFLEYNEANFNQLNLKNKFNIFNELKTCIDTIYNNNSEFKYKIIEKDIDYEGQMDTKYCMPYKKIKYYKNGNIQYIGYYPDEYAIENNPQYFSPDGVVNKNCTFKNGGWIFTNLDGNKYIEYDEHFGVRTH